MRLKEKVEAEESYVNLVQYLLFLVLYLFVLSYQKNSFDDGSQNLHTILRENVFSEEGGTFTIYGGGECEMGEEIDCADGEYIGNSIEYGGDLFETEVSSVACTLCKEGN